MSRGHRPRKRFGQHFLTDATTIGQIVAAIQPQDSDILVEVGPGQGAISEPLAKLAGEFHAIELDRDLAAVLRRQFASQANVTIHEGDVLKFDFPTIGTELRIVGNLPYNISTPLLFRLVEFRQAIHDMHFMLQKEVVDLMAAGPGSKTYGRLSIMLGCHFQIDALFDVDRQAFEPPPEVTSAVVRLAPLPEGTYVINDEERFSRIVAQAFSQRRKTIRNSLRNVADEALLESVGIDPGLRPEAISIADYVRLSNALE